MWQVYHSGGMSDNRVGSACAKAEIKQNSPLSAQFGSEFKTVQKIVSVNKNHDKKINKGYEM